MSDKTSPAAPLADSVMDSKPGVADSPAAAGIGFGMAPPPTRDQVIQRLAQATLATAGVSRLVPSLKDAVGRLRSQHSADPEPADQVHPGDGITLRIADKAASATLDISLTAGACALETALAVQSAGLTVLTISYPDWAAHSHVRVNVLSLEPDTADTDSPDPADATMARTSTRRRKARRPPPS